MNITTTKPAKRISKFLRIIDQPTRINILLIISEGEACVCHLEAILKLRQAYISQHLMALREADILTTRREGRYIFYRLRDNRLIGFIEMAGSLAGVDKNELERLRQKDIQVCECPSCEAKQGQYLLLASHD
jgi:ArsR family transcriptional regulator